MNNPVKFILPEGADQKLLIGGLAEYYTIKTGRPILASMAFYDTFDWRLFNRSLVLYASAKRLFLRDLYTNENIDHEEISPLPVFLWDFPEGEIKKRLAPIIKMRALCKLVEVYSSSTSYRILNPDEKTVARLVHEEIHSSRRQDSPTLAAYLWLQPVKGYPKYFRGLINRINEAGFGEHKKEDIYFKALSKVDKEPGSYSSKIKIKLDPNMRSDEASKIILRFLLQVMKTNEAYIEKDVDTEFLHDYRVAIRRTRSALSQLKNVFPKQTTMHFKKDFSFLGKLSNQLRDLDVYLLKENAYKAMLPPVLNEDLKPLFDYLGKKRLKALKLVIGSFKSEKYRAIMDAWEMFLNEPLPDSPLVPNAEVKILTLARKKIYKQYRSTIAAGKGIKETNDDEKLHALRIECKKLRYLMEFFSSLFARKKINTLIKQLKKLQNNLGDFNDLCVQEAYLLKIAEELPASGSNDKKSLLAIGSLVGALDGKKQDIKKTFSTIFTEYASPPNKRLFRDLFASK